jgi:hypothetical protein
MVWGSFPGCAIVYVVKKIDYLIYIIKVGISSGFRVFRADAHTREGERKKLRLRTAGNRFAAGEKSFLGKAVEFTG